VRFLKNISRRKDHAICNHLENCFLFFESATQNFLERNNVVIEQSRSNDTF